VTGTSANDQPRETGDRSPIGRRSLGIFGGTFNPPHLGHLAVARHALSELALERVLLMPAHISPYKLTEEGPGAEHRLNMCRLAVEGVEGLSVSTLELERGGPSYTVDTLRTIHESDPDAQLTFIVGADTASTLGTWREPREILERARLAVAARTGSARRRVIDTVTALLPAGLDGGSADRRVTFLEMGAVEVSSSMVRERVARGETVEGLLSPAVAGYIAEHGLYRAGEDAEAHTMAGARG
jgi:nicotinate-nucleotide adenylyltransferase